MPATTPWPEIWEGNFAVNCQLDRDQKPQFLEAYFGEFRPEHLRPSESSEAYVTGTVEMVEQLGADTLIHIGHGNDLVIARIPHGVYPEIGATFSVTADPNRVFLFDAASGARVR